MRTLIAISFIIAACGSALADPAAQDGARPDASTASGSRIVASAPAASPEAMARLELSPKEVQDLKVALDAAVRASGYSPVSVSALGIGAKLERAVADAAKPKDGEKH